MYYDNSLVSNSIHRGKAITNDEDIYVGRGTKNNRIGVAGAGFDNIQVFNKALTAEEITILALANKDVNPD